MDRNKEFLRIRAGQLANERFARQLREGQAAILDRFGVPIQTGSIVLWRPPYDLQFQVLESAPMVSVDPRQQIPPGMITLTLTSGTIPMSAVGNIPQMAFVVCGQVEQPDKDDGEGGSEPPKDGDHGPN